MRTQKSKSRILNYPTADDMGILQLSALVASTNALVE